MGWIGVRRLGVATVAVASLASAGTAVASAHPVLVRPAPMIATAPLSPFGLGNDVVTSSNWSGYAVEAASVFTDVRGSWVEPAATCNTFGAHYAAFWAGIDGYSSESVEQLGTDSDCNGYDRPSYYAWYEMYPAAPVTLSSAAYPVEQGDTLSAEVSVNGAEYTLSLKSSRGWTFQITKLGIGLDQSSAELIAEAPSTCILSCHALPLANFGTVPFSNVEAAVGGGSDAAFDSFTTDAGPHDIVAQNLLGTVKAQPSSLTPSAAGDSFSVTWHHS